MLATIVAGGLTVAATGTGGTANAAGSQRSSAAVGRAQPGNVPALDAVLGLTRSVNGRTYRAARHVLRRQRPDLAGRPLSTDGTLGGQTLSMTMKEIDDYLASVEEPKRSTLEALRRSILGARS